MPMEALYANIISELKEDSELSEHVINFWDNFDNYGYNFPKLCDHLISIIDTTCDKTKEEFLSKLSIYIEIFGKCVELNLKIANNLDTSDSIDQLMVLNIMSILISKINSICLEEDNSIQMLELLQDMTEEINLIEIDDMDETQSLKKIRHKMTQKLCKFIFYFI